MAHRRLACGAIRRRGLIVVRVIAVTAALVRSGVSTPEKLFIGWFGPRGIGTVVLGLLVLDKGEFHEHGLITQVVAVTVTLSLVIHSLSAPVGIRLCDRTDQKRTAQA